MKYKEKQREQEEKQKEMKKGKVVYESGKRVGYYGNVIKKGIPYRKPDATEEQKSNSQA